VATRLVDDRWQTRATRARRLAGEHPAVADTLDFYADLAEAQDDLLHRTTHALIGGSGSFADRLDPGVVFGVLPSFLTTIARLAPAPLLDALPAIHEHDRDRWRHRIETYWITGGREAWDADEIQQFILEALLQPFAESVAGTSGIESRSGDGPSACPACSGTPVVALLREQGHGARRSLVCGLCLTEWPALRLVCVACGESQFEALPNFRADELPTARIDVCESCQTYLKTIDLTRDAAASPIVDDLASLPLDLWARDRGYRRSRPNLLRL
jgi:FdhE protein